MIRYILSFVVWCILFNYATIYGSIWQSQNHPTPNVRAQFAGGVVESGSLSRNWNRDFVLTKADGAQISFKEDSVVGMSFFRDPADIGYWQKWRAWAPAVFLSFILLLFAFLPLIQALADRNNESDKR